jgi:hypothetical protein
MKTEIYECRMAELESLPDDTTLSEVRKIFEKPGGVLESLNELPGGILASLSEVKPYELRFILDGNDVPEEITLSQAVKQGAKIIVSVRDEEEILDWWAK